jgi:DNA repair exonuclease SbcCD ATPase subunit
MLTPKLQEIKEKIEAKTSYLRSEKEKQLLQELLDLDNFLHAKSESVEFRESVTKNAQITSGPGGACPCCGR